MSTNKSGIASFAGGVASGAFRGLATVFALPVHLMTTIPYYLICATGLDKMFDRLATKIGFGKEKEDPVKLEAWARDLYKDSENFMVNFNRIDEYRDYVFDPGRFPSAHIPVPPNLERGVFHTGKIFSQKMTKDDFFSGLHFNPTIWADGYSKTKGRALAIGAAICGAATLTLLYFVGGDFINFSFTTAESWGSLGEDRSFSFVETISSSVVSLIAMAVCALPLIFSKKIAASQHDILALNEVLIDIESQMSEYGGFQASKEEVSLASIEGVKAGRDSQTLYKQRKEYWRQFKSGEPMIPVNLDDGMARARCSTHGYEPGTQIQISLSDMNQNLLGTGKIGSGKTRTFGMPFFKWTVESLARAGFPIQGFGLDGKATVYHRMIPILEAAGVPDDRFILIGVDEGQYGIPIFHGLAVEKCIDILDSTTKGESDGFFTPSALAQIGRVLHIAKAVHQTPIGVKYEIQTGGCTVDSPEWVKRMCNNPEALYAVIAELTECLEKNEALSYALYDDSLKSAIDGCLEDWKNMLKSEETSSSVVSTINVFLKDFVSNGKILERFGQGRVGPMYKDLSLCLNGYFFFSALADTEYGDAARKINIFARARLYNLVTLREIEFKKAGKNPQSEPVMVFIDEHHLMASSGTTGLADASILNISRSMGLIFMAMTQSTDAYETVLGKLQTENMVQQMLTRFFLPTKSISDAKWMEESCGTGYRLATYIPGVASSEGSRELAQGGLMVVPRTSIKKLSVRTPLGMPTTILPAERRVVESRSNGIKGSFTLTGYFGQNFTFGSGVNYVSAINSPNSIAKSAKDAYERENSLNFGATFGFLTTKREESERASLRIAEIAQVVKADVEKELSSRGDGIERTPLFTNDDLIAAGNFSAVTSIPQFGIEHWCQVELEAVE